MRNSKLKIVVFLADSVLTFSTKIYIFIKHPQNRDFLDFSIDIPVQICPDKVNSMQNFCSWY